MIISAQLTEQGSISTFFVAGTSVGVEMLSELPHDPYKLIVLVEYTKIMDTET